MPETNSLRGRGRRAGVSLDISSPSRRHGRGNTLAVLPSRSVKPPGLAEANPIASSHNKMVGELYPATIESYRAVVRKVQILRRGRGDSTEVIVRKDC